MDLLGKEGEEAREQVEQLSQKLEQLESHLNGVDAALKDFQHRQEKSEQLLEDEQAFQEDELVEMEKLVSADEIEEEEIDELRDRIKGIEKRQHTLMEKVKQVYDSGFAKIIKETQRVLHDTARVSHSLKDRMDQLEEELEELDTRFTIEVNSREFDFERKLDRTEFEQAEKDFYNEVKKLRASINILAEELDKKNEIE